MGKGKPNLSWRAVKALYNRVALRVLGNKAPKGSALSRAQALIAKESSAQKTLRVRASAFLKALSEGVSAYVKANRRTVLKYTGLYVLLWSIEWSIGAELEYVVTALLLLSLAYDLYIYFSHPRGGAYYLILLKARELLMKKRTKLQELLGGILLTLYAGSRGFLANPSLRLAQAQVFRVASLGWLIVFLNNLFESVAHVLLITAKGGLPCGYHKGRQEAIFFLEDFCYEISLYHNTSHVIGWLLSLGVFLALTSKVLFLTNADLPPLIVGALKTSIPHAALFFVLEALKAQLMDYIILFQDSLTRDISIGLYFLFQPAWTMAVYYSIFRYCWARATRTQVEVFCLVFSLVGRHGANPFIKGLTALLKYGYTAVGFMVCCSLYLLIRALLF